jgi:hypothetical protein
MDIPIYVTSEEVGSVCQELGLCDWSKLDHPEIASSEAEVVRDNVGGEAINIPLAAFQNGLQVELEHGTRFPDANITNNHPILTGKIVLAHLKESLEYYERLQIAELEGDLLEAIKSGNADKAAGVMAKLAAAKMQLAEFEAGQLR